MPLTLFFFFQVLGFGSSLYPHTGQGYQDQRLFDCFAFVHNYKSDVQCIKYNVTCLPPQCVLGPVWLQDLRIGIIWNL